MKEIDLTSNDANVGMILLLADNETCADAVRFELGGGECFSGISHPVCEQLDTYRKLLNCAWLQEVPVRWRSLRQAGFVTCYVDEEGKLNGCASNTTASECCDAKLVGRALLVKTTRARKKDRV